MLVRAVTGQTFFRGAPAIAPRACSPHDLIFAPSIAPPPAAGIINEPAMSKVPESLFDSFITFVLVSGPYAWLTHVTPPPCRYARPCGSQSSRQFQNRASRACFGPTARA